MVADISVVIPAYNAAPFIAEALASIAFQTLAPLEVIVVDDASSDETADIVSKSAAVRLLRQGVNRGQAAALNRGIAESHGAFLAFLDADDLWRPNKLSLQRSAFDADPELDAVYGLVEERVQGVDERIQSVDERTKSVDGHMPSVDERAKSIEGVSRRHGRVLAAHLPSALLVRRAALLRVGGFDESFRLGSVVDWYSRALSTGLRCTVLNEIVYERRIHGGNVSITRAAHRDDYLDVVRAALARRRSGNSGTQG